MDMRKSSASGLQNKHSFLQAGVADLCANSEPRGLRSRHRKSKRDRDWCLSPSPDPPFRIPLCGTVSCDFSDNQYLTRCAPRLKPKAAGGWRRASRLHRHGAQVESVQEGRPPPLPTVPQKGMGKASDYGITAIFQYVFPMRTRGIRVDAPDAELPGTVSGGK